MTVSGKKGLKEARRELGLTQVQLAAKTGVSQQFISSVERKKRPYSGCIRNKVRVLIQEEEKRVFEASKHAGLRAEIQPSVPKPKGYIPYLTGSCRIKEEHRCVLDGCRSHCPFVHGPNPCFRGDRPATGVSGAVLRRNSLN